MPRTAKSAIHGGTNNAPSTKTAAIRQAVHMLGGVEQADTHAVIAYAADTWNIRLQPPEVSQWKSNERRRIREGGGEVVESVTKTEPPARAKEIATEAAMTLGDLQTLAGLVGRYGVESVRGVLTTFYGE